MTRLTRLDVSHNRLWPLNPDHESPNPESSIKKLQNFRFASVILGRLTRLTRLDVSHNRLSTLPADLASCHHIQYLSIEGASETLQWYLDHKKQRPPTVGICLGL